MTAQEAGSRGVKNISKTGGAPNARVGRGGRAGDSVLRSHGHWDQETGGD